MPKSRTSWLKRFATPLAPNLEGKEFRTVIFVAISFQVVFTGYRSIQNLQSSLNEEEGIGVISLGVLYGAWIFSGMLTPMALRFLTTKGTMMLAWVCHVLYTAASFYPAWEVLLPTSFLLGAFSAPLWTSQSLYITACGYSYAKTATDSPYHIFSRFNGIFFAIYETSQITGNLVSSLVLQRGVGNRSEGVLFKVCGPGDCPNADNATDLEEPEDWVIDVLVSVYATCNIAGFIITYFFVMPLPKSDWNIMMSSRDAVASFFVTIWRTDIMLMAPLFIFQGMQQATLFSEYTRSYVSCPVGIHMVGFVMAAHGATTPIVTWSFSRVVKLTGRYPLFVLAGLINLMLMVVMYLWTPDKDDIAVIFLAPICWGVSEGIWLTQTNSLIAIRYHDRKEAAFAIYHTGRSVGLALTFAYSSFLCASVKLAVGMAFVLWGLTLYTVSEVRVRWKQKYRKPETTLRTQNGETVGTLARNAISLTDLRDIRPKRSSDLHSLSTVSLGLPSPTTPSPTSAPDSLLRVQSVGAMRRVPSVTGSSTSTPLSSLSLMARQADTDARPTLAHIVLSRASVASEESYF